MIAYKVVSQLSDIEFVSAIASAKARVTYALDEQVKIPGWLAERKHYPMLFSTARDAIRFYLSMIASIYDPCFMECVVEDEVSLPVFCEIDDLAQQIFNPSGSNFPEGSVSFKKVIPRAVHKPESFLVQNGAKYVYIYARRGLSSCGYRRYNIGDNYLIRIPSHFSAARCPVYYSLPPTLNGKTILSCLQYGDSLVLLNECDRVGE